MAAAENKIGEMTDVGGTRRHSLTEVNKFPIEWVGGFCGGGFDKAPCSATIDDRIVALNFLHTTARHFWEVGGVSFFDLGLCWCSFISFGIIIRCMAEANIQVRKHVSKVCCGVACIRDSKKMSKNIYSCQMLGHVHDFDRRKQQIGFDRTLPPRVSCTKSNPLSKCLSVNLKMY
jgi:hypothetical protein